MDDCFGSETDLRKIDGHLFGKPLPVKQADDFAAITHWLHPDFKWTFLSDPVTLPAQRILVNGEDFSIRQQFDGIGGHLGEIVSGNQRSGEDGPKAHVRAVLVVIPPLPTSSMSGSFQWPGPTYFSRPF